MTNKNFILSSLLSSIIFLLLIIFTHIHPRSIGYMWVIYGMFFIIFWLFIAAAVRLKKVKIRYFFIIPFFASFFATFLTNTLILPVALSQKINLTFDFVLMYFGIPYLLGGVWIVSFILLLTHFVLLKLKIA